MRILLAFTSLSALLIGAGCRSHTSGQCDCATSPQSGYVAPPAANYPVLGGSSVSNAPTTIAPNTMMGGSSAPAAMPSTLPGVPMAK